MHEGGFGGPSIDVGLVAISRALGFPTGSATALFALGRTVGWVAHALEQQDAGFLVRPRARYRDGLDSHPDRGPVDAPRRDAGATA